MVQDHFTARGEGSVAKVWDTVTALPEEADRTKKAVEAIATNSKGDSIAFEHTLIQPFVGDKTDTQPLLKVTAVRLKVE